MKTVSAVIVNRNGQSLFAGEQIPDVARHYHGRPMLEGCLTALAPLAQDPDAELLLVDNGSTDGSVEMLRASFPSVRLILNPENRGFAPAVLQAAALSSARFLLLVNSDVIIDPPRVRRLIREMESRPKLGVLACRTEYPGGLLQAPASFLPTPGRVLAQLLGLGLPHDRSFDAGSYGEPEWVAGGLLLIRREAWDAVGGFDPGFLFYEEDADLCLRLRAAGWGIGYTPEVTVMHVRAATAERDPAFSLTQRYRSLLHYAGKHFPWPAVLLIRLVLCLRMLVRALVALVRGEPVAGAALRLAAEALTRA